MFLMSSSLIKVEKELPLVFPNKGWGPLVQRQAYSNHCSTIFEEKGPKLCICTERFGVNDRVIHESVCWFKRCLVASKGSTDSKELPTWIEANSVLVINRESRVDGGVLVEFKSEANAL